MEPRIYDSIANLCVVVAVLSALLFDWVGDLRWLIGGVGVIAAGAASITYFYNQRQLAPRQSQPESKPQSISTHFKSIEPLVLKDYDELGQFELGDLPIQFIEAEEYYENVLKKDENWLERYLGKVVAIVGTHVVDSDGEFHKLASRVREAYGYGSVFMPLVTRGPWVEYLGPRLEGE